MHARMRASAQPAGRMGSWARPCGPGERARAAHSLDRFGLIDAPRGDRASNTRKGGRRNGGGGAAAAARGRTDQDCRPPLPHGRGKHGPAISRSAPRRPLLTGALMLRSSQPWEGNRQVPNPLPQPQLQPASPALAAGHGGHKRARAAEARARAGADGSDAGAGGGCAASGPAFMFGSRRGGGGPGAACGGNVPGPGAYGAPAPASAGPAFTFRCRPRRLVTRPPWGLVLLTSAAACA